MFGPFRAIVDAILAADETAPRKQRHTAMQIFRRLVAEHGYTGGYDQVRRYLQQQRLDRRETFIPLDHDPGQRAEADFGHIHVDFPDGRRLVPVLIVTWAYSNCPVRHGPADRADRGHPARPGRGVRVLRLRAARGVVGQPDDGGDPHLPRPGADAAPALRGPGSATTRSTPMFCMPADGDEKPRVENRVYDLQRQWATPVPRVDRPGRVERPPAALLPGGPRADVRRQQRVGRRALRAGPGRGAAGAGAAVRCLRASSPARWTSTRRCASTATATACRGAGRSGR